MHGSRLSAAAPVLPSAAAMAGRLSIETLRRWNGPAMPLKDPGHRSRHPDDYCDHRLREGIAVKAIIGERRGMPPDRGRYKHHLVVSLEANESGPSHDGDNRKDSHD